jgi:hypothetical protein
LIGNYASAQQWRLREFDENGQLEVNTEEVDPRVLLTTRLASRPLKNKQFEMAATIWNITAFAERHREHPKGQLVGPRAYGSINYEF